MTHATEERIVWESLLVYGWKFYENIQMRKHETSPYNIAALS